MTLLERSVAINASITVVGVLTEASASAAAPTASAISAENPGWPNRSGSNPPASAASSTTPPGAARKPATAFPAASPITAASGLPASIEATKPKPLWAAASWRAGSVPSPVIRSFRERPMPPQLGIPRTVSTASEAVVRTAPRIAVLLCRANTAIARAALKSSRTRRPTRTGPPWWPASEPHRAG